jgi:metal-responsive CopG/Arc/MetJ family transcriptional regulator
MVIYVEKGGVIVKNTTTISISIPVDLAAKIDSRMSELNLSRSALLTMIISLFFKGRGV